jgi:hypothetical protein
VCSHRFGGDNRFREKTGNDFDDRADFQPVKGKYTMVELDYGANDDDVRAAAYSFDFSQLCWS